MPKPDLASISIAAQNGTTVVYDVFQGKGNKNPYQLWVRQECRDADGTPVSIQHQPVRWEQLPYGTTDAFTITGVDGEAAVVEYPDVWTPVSNTVTFAA